MQQSQRDGQRPLGQRQADRHLQRQRAEIERQRRNEHTQIPGDFDYAHVRGLSAEVLGKLQRVQPATIGQALRISGVTPAAISLLLVHLKRGSARAAG